MDPPITFPSSGSQGSPPSQRRSLRFPTVNTIARPESPLRPRARASSANSAASDDKPEILAPTPRRHLLESSASQHWLRTPPHSPGSSRATSPPGNSLHRLSFSALREYDRAAPASPGSTVADGHSSIPHERSEDTATMGRRWIRWMHKRGMKRLVVPGAVGAALWVKWAIGLGSYSGEGTPPMFGDYEAQRHWMELTIHLPPRQWYTYDVLYWGLDYPPLTAYASWLCGMIGSWIEPSWFALEKSRGIETQASKNYMRATVIVLDALIYVPALIMFARTWQGTRSRRTQNLALLALLLQPALLLVDFGHFQYNSVMLGLTLFAINFFATGHDVLGAVCFVLSLGFKQMALYYAPAIGTYLIAKCIYLGPVDGGRLFVRLAFTTVLSFLLLFLPFLPPFAPLTTVLDPIRRIFPFSRGLFEDKVANFWCASNVVIKWRAWASRGALVKLSAGLTTLGFLPSVLVVLGAGVRLRGTGAARGSTSPLLPLLPYALLTSALSFFLFSFQVHEKTILVPLLPLTLLLSGAAADSDTFAWGALVNNIAVFSMWPLLRRDGLGAPYIATLLLWNRLIGHNPFRAPRRSPVRTLSLAAHAAALAVHMLEHVVSPPARYPDLFPVLNVLVSTPVFALTWLWSLRRTVEAGWALSAPAPAPVAGRAGGLRGDSLGRAGGVRAMSLGALGRQTSFASRASSTAG